jgi:hypothetical protein
MSRFIKYVAFAFAVLCLGSRSAQAGFNVYVSAPSAQSIDATITGVATETFNSTTPNTNVGTYTSTVPGVTYTTLSGTAKFQANDLYGGYLQSYYLGLAANSSLAANLITPQQYFGLYYSAADASNSISFYSGSTLLLTLNTSTLLSYLPNNNTSTVTSINGSVYNTKSYYGQPTSGLNTSEPYAYLSFIATGGTTFDKIVLNQGSSGIFETDNHSFRLTAPTVPGSYVLIPNNFLPPIPEPTTYGMLGLGALGLLIAKIRQKKNCRDTVS